MLQNPKSKHPPQAPFTGCFGEKVGWDPPFQGRGRALARSWIEFGLKVHAHKLDAPKAPIIYQYFDVPCSIRATLIRIEDKKRCILCLSTQRVQLLRS